MLVCVMLINSAASMGTHFPQRIQYTDFQLHFCAFNNRLRAPESGIVTENMRRWVANQSV